MLDKFKLLSQKMQFLIVLVLSIGLYGLLEIGRNVNDGALGANTVIHAAIAVFAFYAVRYLINSNTPKEADSAPTQAADDFYDEK